MSFLQTTKKTLAEIRALVEQKPGSVSEEQFERDVEAQVRLLERLLRQAIELENLLGGKFAPRLQFLRRELTVAAAALSALPQLYGAFDCALSEVVTDRTQRAMPFHTAINEVKDALLTACDEAERLLGLVGIE